MFQFLNPWMLLGTLLVGIPIVIHILNRSRYRVEPWGAMMFLQKAMQIRSQRIKVEQILLLVLRCLFSHPAGAGPVPADCELGYRGLGRSDHPHGDLRWILFHASGRR